MNLSKLLLCLMFLPGCATYTDRYKEIEASCLAVLHIHEDTDYWNERMRAGHKRSEALWERAVIHGRYSGCMEYHIRVEKLWGDY